MSKGKHIPGLLTKWVYDTDKALAELAAMQAERAKLGIPTELVFREWGSSRFCALRRIQKTTKQPYERNNHIQAEDGE